MDPDVVLKQMLRGSPVLLLSVLADDTLGGQLQQQKGSAALGAYWLALPSDLAVLLLAWTLLVPVVPNNRVGLVKTM